MALFQDISLGKVAGLILMNTLCKFQLVDNDKKVFLTDDY